MGLVFTAKDKIPVAKFRKLGVDFAHHYRILIHRRYPFCFDRDV